MKQTGMLVVSLRGVNFRFWSRLGCSGQSAKKHRITRRETEVKFSFTFSFQIKAFDDYVRSYIIKSHCMLYLCVFKRSLLGVKICLSHAQIGLLQGSQKLEPRPDGLLQGLNSKFPTSIPVCSIWGSPLPGTQSQRFQILPARRAFFKAPFS